MTRERLVRIGVLIWLAVLYTALWGNASIANLLAGLVVGILIMVLLPLPRVPVKGGLRVLPLIELVVLTAYYAIESSLQIAWFAVRPAGAPVSGVLRVRLAPKHEEVRVESGAGGGSSHRGGAGRAGAGAQSGAGNRQEEKCGKETKYQRAKKEVIEQ